MSHGVVLVVDVFEFFSQIDNAENIMQVITFANPDERKCTLRYR